MLLIVTASATAFWYAKNSPTPEPTEPVVCTMEALSCPDGSYVARSGPKCAFAACPNQPSFTGMLKQDPNGLTLIIAAPIGGQEVAYAMPLVVKDASALSQLVGKNVRVYGTFTEGTVLAVDHFDVLSGNAADVTLGEVGVGKNVFINGVRITLNSVSKDSRCPVDVKCIQAGSITANVTLQSDTDKETKDIVSSAKPVLFDSYQISIESIMPDKVSTTTLKPDSYIVTFRVRSN